MTGDVSANNTGRTGKLALPVRPALLYGRRPAPAGFSRSPMSAVVSTAVAAAPVRAAATTAVEAAAPVEGAGPRRKAPVSAALDGGREAVRDATAAPRGDAPVKRPDARRDGRPAVGTFHG